MYYSGVNKKNKIAIPPFGLTVRPKVTLVKTKLNLAKIGLRIPIGIKP